MFSLSSIDLRAFQAKKALLWNIGHFRNRNIRDLAAQMIMIIEISMANSTRCTGLRAKSAWTVGAVPSWAILHVAEIWLTDRYEASKPDWLNSQMVKTPFGEFSIFDNLGSDDVQHAVHLCNWFHQNRCSFDPDANRPTNYFFHMTLPTVEGISIPWV